MEIRGGGSAAVDREAKKTDATTRLSRKEIRVIGVSEYVLNVTN